MCLSCHHETDLGPERAEAHLDGLPDCIRWFETYKDGGAELKLQDAFFGCVDCGEQYVTLEHCCYD